MTTPAAAPAPSQLPAAPALNTPEGMAARKNSHPALRGQTQPGTEPAAPVHVPDITQAAAPIAPPPAATITPPVATPVPDVGTNLLEAATPPPMRYTTPEPAAPAVDPVISALQSRLDEQDAALRQQQQLEARNQLLNPVIDYSAIGDIPEDQAQALHTDLVQPQIAAIYDHFDKRFEAQAAEHREALSRVNQTGATVQEVAHQQQVSENDRLVALNSAVQTAHPTFQQDFNDPTFIAAAGPYHQEIAQAYHRGDAAQVVSVMNYVKSHL